MGLCPKILRLDLCLCPTTEVSKDSTGRKQLGTPNNRNWHCRSNKLEQPRHHRHARPSYCFDAAPLTLLGSWALKYPLPVPSLVTHIVSVLWALPSPNPYRLSLEFLLKLIITTTTLALIWHSSPLGQLLSTHILPLPPSFFHWLPLFSRVATTTLSCNDLANMVLQ